MKKIFLFLLSAVLTVGVFSSCGKKKPLEISEEEAFSVLSELVPRSYEFNVIFFGEGLPVVEYEGEYTDTAYFAVDTGTSSYASVAALKNAAERVYSSGYLEDVYVNMFIGSESTSEDGLLDNDVSPRYKEIDGALMIDVSYPVLNISGKLTVISAEIVKKTPEYVSVDAVCKDEDGNEVTRQFFITLEDDVWLLDGPTY